MEEGKRKIGEWGKGWKVDRLSKQLWRAANRAWCLWFLDLDSVSVWLVVTLYVEGRWTEVQMVCECCNSLSHPHSPPPPHPHTASTFKATLWLPESLDVHFWEFSAILSWSFPFPRGDAHSFHQYKIETHVDTLDWAHAGWWRRHKVIVSSTIGLLQKVLLKYSATQ